MAGTAPGETGARLAGGDRQQGPEETGNRLES
jgi:hypothetical protein